MFSSKKLAIFVVLMMIAPVILTACATPEPEVVEVEKIVTQIVEVVVTEIVEVAGTPEVIEKIVEVEVTVAPPPVEEEPEPGEGEPGPYRIALFEDPITLNHWSYLGPSSSVWTQYVLSDQAPSLFELSDVTFQWVPSLAAEVPEPVDNGDGTWTITVPMGQNAMWSDGEPITAHDYVFTFNACKDLKLTHNWPNQCKPNELARPQKLMPSLTAWKSPPWRCRKASTALARS